MGLGHVPQEPIRPEGQGADLQRRQRGRTAGGRSPDLARQARGRWGEREAARWYQRHGYEVLDRNWRCAAGEIDLVLAGDRVIVFAEVKSRANDAFGGAAAAVDARKRARLRRLALEWLAAHPEVRRAQLRFDVVAITGTKIDVIEAAF